MILAHVTVVKCFRLVALILSLNFHHMPLIVSKHILKEI